MSQTAGLDCLREVTELPRSPSALSDSARLELLLAEATIRDLTATWSYTLDARDIDGIMDFFAEDAVLINPRGRFVGHEAIRRNYEGLLDRWPFARHWYANVVVRFPDDPSDARLAAYCRSQYTTEDRTIVKESIAADFWRLKNTEAGWKITKRSFTTDIQLEQHQ